MKPCLEKRRENKKKEKERAMTLLKKFLNDYKLLLSLASFVNEINSHSPHAVDVRQ